MRPIPCRHAPPACAESRGEGVRRVRGLLGMSQAAFAAFLGADPSTVRSWEQGLRPPGPLACRMLSEIEADPSHWRRRLMARWGTSTGAVVLPGKQKRHRLSSR